MDMAVVILSFYIDNSEISPTICFICGHFPCRKVRHRLATDSWRMRTSVIMRWHRWHNSNKQTGVLFGLKETYCVTQKY